MTYCAGIRGEGSIHGICPEHNDSDCDSQKTNLEHYPDNSSVDRDLFVPVSCNSTILPQP